MNQKPAAGFSLIEMTLVMAIAAILGSVALPRAQQGYKLRLVEKTAVEVHHIQAAAKNYHRDTGNWPAIIADLQATGYLPAGWTPNDPWGNAYAVSNNGTTFSVGSVLPAEYTKALQSYLPNTTVDTTTNTVTSTTPLPGDEPSHDALLPRDGSRDMTGDLVINKDTPSVKLYDTVSGLSSWVRNVGGVFKVQNDSNVDLLTVDQAGNGGIRGDFTVGKNSPTTNNLGYGPKLWLGNDMDNTDSFWMARNNISSNVSEWRVNVGDDDASGLSDRFVVGAVKSGGGWQPNFTVDTLGRVGINTDAPTNTLTVIQKDSVAANSEAGQRISVRSNVGLEIHDRATGAGAGSSLRLTTGDGLAGAITASEVAAGSGSALNFQTSPDQSSLLTRMTIAAGGNVGIGTTTPTERLQVNGDIRVGLVSPAGAADAAGYGNFLYFSGGPGENGADSDNSDPLWLARYNASSDNTELRLNIGDNVVSDQPVDKLVIGATPTGGSWSPMITMTSAGRVGIRNPNPELPLDVAGAIRSSSGYGVVPSATGLGTVTMAGGGASPDAGSLLWGDNTGWKFHMGTSVGGAFTPRVTFMDTGRIGIGNTAPTAPLTIGARIPSNPQPPASDNVDQRIMIQPESYDGPWRLVTREMGGSKRNNLEWMYGNAATGLPLISMQIRDSQGWTGFGLKDPVSRHHFAGDIRMGVVSPAGTVDTAGYGNRLIFSGGPAQNGADSDNWSPSWIARYNRMADESDLRIAFGDTWADRLLIGEEDTGSGAWSTRLSVTSGGGVGIGTDDPQHLLDIRGGANREAITFYTDGDASAYSDITQAIETPGAIAAGLPISFNWSLRKDGYFSGDTSGPTYELYTDISGGGNRAPLLIKSNGDLILNGAARNVVGNGNVGIGTATPTEKLHVNGNIYASGTVTSASDRRFKRDIHYLDPAKSLSQILRLQPARYQWRQEDFPDRRFPNGEDLGLIAQEVEAVLPQLVHTDQKGYKSLEYAKFAPVLISAVQALHQELQTYAAVRIIDDAAQPDPKLLGSLLSVSKTRTPDKTVKGYLSARDVYLADAGRWASEAGNGYAYNQVFRADTDWVVPAGVTEIRIELWGGGGAQGGAATQFGEHQTAVATAGNPGGHLQKQLTVKPGQAFPVRLGTGSEPGLAIVWW